MIPQPPSGQGPVDPHGSYSTATTQRPPQHPGARAQGAPGGPPPGMMPPMFPPGYPPQFYPPPQKSGGGFTRGIFVTLATTIFGFSLLLNVYLLMFSVFSSSG